MFLTDFFRHIDPKYDVTDRKWQCFKLIKCWLKVIHNLNCFFNRNTIYKIVTQIFTVEIGFNYFNQMNLILNLTLIFNFNIVFNFVQNEIKWHYTCINTYACIFKMEFWKKKQF